MQFFIYLCACTILALILSIIKEHGILLGGIPTAILYTITFIIAERLCRNYRERKVAQKGVEPDRKNRYEPKFSSHKTVSVPIVISILAMILSVASLGITLIPYYSPTRNESDYVPSTETSVPSYQKTTLKRSQNTERSLTPIPKPINGYVFEDFVEPQEKVAPLKINTSSAGGYYIIIAPYTTESIENLTSKGSKMCIFVRSNSTIDFLVPLGSYEIYFATGDIWYGKYDLFGPETVYQKCDEIFEFSLDSNGYSGWTIELGAVFDGNLDTSRIDENEFPK